MDIDIKKSLNLMMMEKSGLGQSQLDSQRSEDLTSIDSGAGLKRIQQELRVSKKAELMAKDKLVQTKKLLDRSEKEFLKYKEDSETRIENLKNEIAIVQKHYEQLQNNVNESEHERSSNMGTGDKNSDLLKIIEEYSRQADLKSKEVEQLVQKMDNKKTKIDELKKIKSDQEQKISRQKSALDNIKMFLRVLNSNFQKSINSVKQQNVSIKEQYEQAQKVFMVDLEDMKKKLTQQITSIVLSKEKQIKELVGKQQISSQEIKSSLQKAEEAFKEQTQLLKQDYITKTQKQKEEHDILIGKKEEMVQKYKTKFQELKQTSLAYKQDSDLNKGQQIIKLEQEKLELVKNLELSKLKNQSDGEKMQLQIDELKKDIVRKDETIEELKNKERLVRDKMEEQDKSYREQIKLLIDKNENEKLSLYQKEVQASGHREAEQTKVIREILETKVSDRDQEIKRLRDQISSSEKEYIKQKEIFQKLIEKDQFDLKEAQNELHREKDNSLKAVQQVQQQVTDKEKKINDQATKIANLVKSFKDSETDRRELSKQISKYLTDIEDYKYKIQECEKNDINALEKQIYQQEKIDQLENQNDKMKVKYDNEIQQLKDQQVSNIYNKDQEIRQMNDDIGQLNTKLSQLNQLYGEVCQQNDKYSQMIYKIESIQKFEIDVQTDPKNPIIPINPTSSIISIEFSAQKIEVEVQTDPIIKHYFQAQTDNTISILESEIEHKSIIEDKNIIVIAEEYPITTEQITLLNPPVKISSDSIISTPPIIKEEEQSAQPAEETHQHNPHSQMIRGSHYGKNLNIVFKAIGQEEESFEPSHVKETVEKRVVIREQVHDMAMRGPTPNLSGRPPVPRGMMPPGGRGRPQMPSVGRPNMLGGPQNFRPRGPFENQPRPTTPIVQQLEQQYQQQQQIDTNPSSLTSMNQAQGFSEVVEQQSPPVTYQVNQENNPSTITSIPQDAPQEIQQKKVEEHKVEKQVPKQIINQQPPTQNVIKQTSPKVVEAKIAEISQPVISEQIKPKESKEEVKKEMPKTQQLDPLKDKSVNQSLFDFRNNRFFGMINGFIGILTRRRQAYTGRPASAMYYDEKKQRWIINGEDESDDDVPPPPPPSKKVIVEDQNSNPDLPKKEEPAQIGGDQLAKVAFGGSLAGRGRGRGQNRYASTFNPGQIQPSTFKPIDPPVQEHHKITQQDQNITSQTNTDITEQQQQNSQLEAQKSPRYIGGEDHDTTQQDISQLYKTTLDITLNQTMYHETNQNNRSIIGGGMDQNQLEEREELWKSKFNQQSEKILGYKGKIQRLQIELEEQREENQQTFTNFEVLCQDLKFRGMDEVEDLQCDIGILKEHLKNMAQGKASQDIKLQQYQESLKYYEEDSEELRTQLHETKLKLIQQEIDHELATLVKMEQQKGLAYNSYEEGSNFQNQLLETQVENDQLKWNKAILEAEKVQLQFDLKDQSLNQDKLKNQLQNLSSENARIQDEVHRLNLELSLQNEDIIKNSEKERESMREWIGKVQQEKDRVQEIQRERIGEYEQRIQKMDDERLRYEGEFTRILREKDSEIKELHNQNEYSRITYQQEAGTSYETMQILKNQISELENKLVLANQLQQQSAVSIQTNKDSVIQKVYYQQFIQNPKNKEKLVSESVIVRKDGEVRDLQEVVKVKLQEIESFESRNQEMSSEIQNLNQLKQKLNEHIVYLQNEIRKRDELLEQQNSDFGGSNFEVIDDYDVSMPGDQFQDDDMDSNRAAGLPTMQNLAAREEEESLRGGIQTAREHLVKGQSHRAEDEIGGMSSPGVPPRGEKKKFEKRKTTASIKQAQLEETRNQLKQQIEERLKLERKVHALEIQETKIQEGINDILAILEQHQVNETIMTEQSSAIDEVSNQLVSVKVASLLEPPQFDQAINTVIGRIFQLQGFYKGELNEMRHKVEMMRFKIDESESLKFDMEMISGEKLMLEEELTEKTQYTKELEAKINDLKKNQDNFSRIDEQLLAQRTQLEENFNKQFTSEKATNQRDLQEVLDKHSKLLATLQDEFKIKFNKLKEKYKNRYHQVEQENNTLKEEKRQFQKHEQKLLEQTQEQQDQIQQLTQNHDSSLKDIGIKDEKLRIQEIELQEMLNNYLSIKKTEQQKQLQLEEELKKNNQEFENEKQRYENQIQEIHNGYQDVIKRVKAKSDKKGTKIKELVAFIKEQMNKDDLVEQHQQQVQEFEVREKDLLQQIQNLQGENNKDQLIEQHKIDLQNVNQLVESCNTKISELQSQIQSQKETIQQLSQQSENQVNLSNQNEGELTKQFNQKEQEIVERCENEKEKLIQECAEREEEFKKQTKELAKTLKEKINHEKDKCKQISKEYEIAQKEKKAIETQIIELKKKMEDDKELGESQKCNQLEEQISDLTKKLNDKQKALDDKELKYSAVRGQLDKEKDSKDKMVEDIKRIITILDQVSESATWEDVILKLKELIQNYDEDRRTLQELMSEKSYWTEQMSQLEQEKSQIIAEKSKLVEKIETNISSKLEKKVHMLQEERNEMRNDFQIKIHSFVEDITSLKIRLSKYEELEEEEEVEQKYSFLKEKSQQRIKDQAEESMKKNLQDSEILNHPADQTQDEKKSGIFNSIASFFLTDSELDNN